MVSKRSYQRFVLLSIVMIVSGMMAWNGIAVQHAKGDSRNDSPLPTPITSPYAQVAIKYLAQKYKIPEERLVVEYEVAQEYPLSSRTFQYFKISDGRAPGSTTFNALVDVVTNKVEEDLHALEATEAAAYRAKFGKLHVTLSERLQNVTDDTVLPVAIWVAGHPVHNEQEIYAIITREFPAALAAIAKGRKLFEVDDPEMANKIQTRYEELLAENTNVRTQPVQAWLEAQGYKWQSDGAIPAVYADLPKQSF